MFNLFGKQCLFSLKCLLNKTFFKLSNKIVYTVVYTKYELKLPAMLVFLIRYIKMESFLIMLMDLMRKKATGFDL